MDTVKLRKKLTNILAMILTIFLAFNLKDVHASSDVVLTFTDTKIKETVSGSGYSIKGTTLEITSAGTYIIKGSSSEGNIEVKKGIQNVTLILDGLNLTSSKTAPIVIKKDGASAKIKIVGTNTLVNNENPDNEFSLDPDIAGNFEGAVVKVKSGSSLTFEGTGQLNIRGNTKNGIKGGSTSSITVNSGVLDIEAANTGFACDGTITINSGMVDVDAYNEGIKLEPDEGDTTSLAALTINGGRVEVNAGEDGIQAMGNININGWPNITINSLSDGIQTRSNFTMTNGNLNIHTFEGYNPSTFDKDGMSAKGIKASATDDVTENATNTITISGGTINIDSSDDALHSDGYINITRGTVNIRSGDDGIHSDTKLVIGSQGGLERDPEINVLESIEGIESGNIYVYSGKVKVVSLDDGMNAAGGASTGSAKEHGEHFNPDTGQMEDNYAIYVYGGSLYVNSEGDGLDANGSIYLYGGTHIIYHQDAQGNNSALDRDAKLVIDGATVFSAGGVADNGHVDSTGSSQKIVINELSDFSANSKVAVKYNGDVVFNDTIPKRSTYTFYSSPNLQEGSTIETVSSIIDDKENPWNHTFNDGVITTPATAQTPGVITYTCSHQGAVQERKTYFYKDEITFSVINKTQGAASVRINSQESTSDFSAPSNNYVYVTTIENIDFITTKDGIQFDKVSPEPTATPNQYAYHVDNNISQAFYVVFNGDVNMDGELDIDDSTDIARSLASTTYEHYTEFTGLQKIIADINDDGLINSHDGLAILKELPGDDVYDESYFDITSVDPVILDGENDGEATISFYTKKAINIDAMDGTYLPNEENPSSNGYLELTDIQGSIQSQFALVDIKNGFAGAVDTNGLAIPKNTALVTLKYKVDKNTPTGTYPVKLRINSVTAHDSNLDATFELVADVIVKGTTDPITAFFNKDEGVDSVDVYYTQSYLTPSETNVSSTTVRNPDTGEIIPDPGEGQVNFKVNLKPGYIISSISATPSNKFKNVKGPADTDNANTYRITKVTGDIEIQITTKQATEYTASFITDDHVSSIDAYHTQDYTTPDEVDISSTYARNSATGAVDISGDGQINFKVNVDPGYRIDKVEVSGSYKNIKDQEDRIYRVTKILGDIIVKVTTAEKVAVTPTVEGYETSYTYTGSKIKPTPTITVQDGEATVPLVKDKDYEIVYGSNNDVGTEAGTMTIKSLDKSNFTFDDILIKFDITPYTLTQDNVTAPSSVVYTGSALTPEISVSANGKALVSGTDYDIAYSNQDGQVGENVTATITGKGNFTGTVNNINVYITDKASQTITFEKSEITKVYGEDFTMTATLSVGDGTITYTSNNTEAATVDPNTGAVTLVGTGQATIRAYASETDTYAQAVASYKLIVKKAPLTINNVTIENKTYDGTKTATVSNVEFGGLVKDETLTIGTDYTVDAEFENVEIGEGKPVSVTVNLSYETIKKYTLADNTTSGTANITTGVITESDITLSQDTYEYNGTARKPDVTVQIGDVVLVKDVDYTLQYRSNVNIGEAKVVIKGIGNYASDTPVEKTFTITKKTVTPTIANIPNVIFNGGEQRPELTVTDGSVTLELNKDYTVEYDNNVDAGTASLKIIPVESSNYTFDSEAEGSSKTFNIIPYTLTDKNITLSYKTVKHDGTAKEPEVTVVADGIPLIKDIHYTVAYNNNTNVGTQAEVTVTAIADNYTGSPKVYFEITNKEVLTISGIENKQTVTYTGNPVVLQGTPVVSANSGNIGPNDLTVKYYNSDNEEISKPTNVGKYKVIYSYDSDDYTGELKIEFSITKATSQAPEGLDETKTGISGEQLSTITLDTEGLSWKEPNTAINPGEDDYKATYTQNNDTTNYTTVNADIPVYGKRKVNINTSVSGPGGTISPSSSNVLEGTTKTITVTPADGYEIEKVTVNGKVAEVTNNTLSVTAGTTDINVEVTYDAITYELNISGTNTTTDPNGIITVNYNANKTVTLDVKYGYRLTSVKVNGEEKISSVVENTLTLNNISSDANIVIKSEKITYEVVEGARQTYTITKDKEALFKINADYNLFKVGGKVYVDDQLVGEENYTSKEGSTVIIFKQNYIDNLKIGTHTLNVIFNDGGYAGTTFNVGKVVNKNTTKPTTTNNTSSNKKGSPPTGDEILKMVGIGLISLIGLIIGIFIIKKDKKKDEDKKDNKVAKEILLIVVGTIILIGIGVVLLIMNL